MIVNFGEPIAVKDFMESYAENPNAAVIALKNKIYEAILPLTINIKSKRFYDEFERIREIYGKHYLKRQNKNYSILNLFKSDQKLVNKLDELETEHPEETEKLASEFSGFHERIKNTKLRSWLFNNKEKHLGKLLMNLFLLLTGLPVFAFGFLFNAIPFFLIDRTIRKKVRDESFWSTFFLGAGLVVFPVLYIAELAAVLWIIPGFWLKLAFLASLPFAGKLAFNWYILLRKTIGLCRIVRLRWFKPPVYSQLIREREQLFEKLDNLISTH